MCDKERERKEEGEGARWADARSGVARAATTHCPIIRVKVVDFLLGDEDKMLKVWKVGGLAECQVVTTSHSE